jgi:hypothetical protein
MHGVLRASTGNLSERKGFQTMEDCLMSEAVFKNLIDALSGKVGVKLEMQDENYVFVDFDDLPVMFEYIEENNRILLAVSVAQAPEEGRETFYAGLLQGQYLFHKTGGATLALDPDARFVSLQVLLEMQNLTPPDFIAQVDDFLRTADFWVKLCGDAGAKRTGAGPQKEEASAEGMLRI